MLKAVLIGLGNIAWKFSNNKNSKSSLSHMDAFLSNNNVELCAGYSPDSNHVEIFSKNTGFVGYDNLNKMLEEISPDIVSICSPQEFHFQHVKLCIDYQVPMIWLEKPAASSADEINSMEKLRVSMKKPSTILVNYQRRYSENYQKLKAIIEKESYGKPLLVEINYSKGLQLNGSHMLDILIYLLPNFSYELLWVDDRDMLDNPSFICRLSDNLNVNLNVNFNGINVDFHNIDIRILFEKARISIEHCDMSLRVEKVVENKIYPGFHLLNDSNAKELGIPGFNYSFDLALEDLINSNNKKIQPKSNLMTALKSQKLLENVLSRII
jgi:predicted dehydrogenase